MASKPFAKGDVDAAEPEAGQSDKSLERRSISPVKAWLVGFAIIIALGVALGVGLGVGLKKNQNKDKM